MHLDFVMHLSIITWSCLYKRLDGEHIRLVVYMFSDVRFASWYEYQCKLGLLSIGDQILWQLERLHTIWKKLVERCIDSLIRGMLIVDWYMDGCCMEPKQNGWIVRTTVLNIEIRYRIIYIHARKELSKLDDWIPLFTTYLSLCCTFGTSRHYIYIVMHVWGKPASELMSSS